MANLVVLGFDGHKTADQVMERLVALQEAGAVTLEDAVIAARPPLGETHTLNYGQGGSGQTTVVSSEAHANEVVIKQTHSKAGKFAKRGAGAGLLVGLLLGGPIGGALAGAGIGALSSRLKDFGIDDKFVKETSQALKVDSSAIFLLGEAAEMDKVVAELRPFQPKVLTTSLDAAQEKQLKQAFS